MMNSVETGRKYLGGTLPTYHARPKLLAWRWSAVSKHGWVARATNLVGSAEIMTGRRRRLLLFRLGLPALRDGR